jgi:hypothetical protein
MTVTPSSLGPQPTGVTGRMGTSLRTYLADARPYQRFLYWCAVLFAASAVVFAVVFVADDRPWDATASWRQPLAFSLAFFLVVPSLAWVMTFLPTRRRLGWAVAGPLGAAAVGTVALIAAQAWREQPAFFPEDFALDNALWTGIQIGIGFIVAAIVVEAVWAFTPLDAPPSIRWAVRAGLVLVVAGLAMGGVMVAEGVGQDEDNQAPGQVDSPIVFGDAGLVLFPHLLALHGLLILSTLAWLLSFTPWPERRRTTVIQVAAAGYAALVAASLVQALDGRAPFDLAGLLAVAFWISVALIIAAMAMTLLGLGRTARPPEPAAR